MTAAIIGMFVTLMIMLLVGYPVAFTLGSVAILFGSIFLGLDFFNLLPLQIWGMMNNFTLLAVPLFIFMGVTLDKSGLAEDLLETMGLLFGKLRGGLAVSVVVVGALLAATTGCDHGNYCATDHAQAPLFTLTCSRNHRCVRHVRSDHPA